MFGDEVLAAAILDRLLHHRHTLIIQGDSYRLKQRDPKVRATAEFLKQLATDPPGLC